MDIGTLAVLAGLIISVGTGSAGIAVFLFKQFASNAISTGLAEKVDKLEGKHNALELQVAILNGKVEALRDVT